MKGKNRRQKKENSRTSTKKRRMGTGAVFALTFCAVLSIGMAGILVMTLLKGEGTDKQEKPEIVDDKGSSFWEKMPEKEAQAEPVMEMEVQNTRYGHELADAEYMKENHILAWESSQADTVTFGFIGDILFDDEYAIMANLLRRGATIDNGISGELLTRLQGVDVLVANNEFPFTERGTPTEGKTYTFRADESTAAYLHDIGVDVAVLANNHIYDFGETGLFDTLDVLERAGIPGIGAGRNLKEASAPLYFIVNDMKIAVIAATQIERLDNPDTKGATEESAGVFRCWNPEKLYQVVAQAKEQSDFVIVFIHWGTENQAEPDWAQLDQAPELARAGADLIIGDHSHCLQGITYFDDTPVIYSLGNFWFNSKTLDTCMVQVTIGREGLESFQFIPAIQSDCRVSLAYGEEKNRILAYMRELSPEVVIDSEGYVSKNIH
ncbi:MAG: CapA family protein [Lachnospiraceae bacterium]|nr:CapA family protein [Lachnospiraceae bacterium]